MKKHSRAVGSDGGKRSSANGKRQCPTCGIATHKKGGLLGKKSIPITLEGRVYRGRCLTCDPFPAKHGPNAAAAAAVVAMAVHEAQTQEEHPRRRLSDNSRRSCNGDGGNGRKTTAASPPVAAVSTIRTLRRKSSRSTYAEPLQHHESNHDTREQQFLQHHQHDQHDQQDEQRGLKTTRIVEGANAYDARAVDDAVPLSSTMLSPPPSRGRAQRAAASAEVPTTLEVVQRRPSRRGSGYSKDGNSSGNFGDDQSVVSAITMDYHLFQSYNGGYDSPDDETNDYDQVPSATYSRRPGPERISGRNFHHGRNHHPFGSSERRRSDSGDIDHNRRHRRRSINNVSVGSSNNSGLSRQSQNLYQHLSRAPPPPTASRHPSNAQDHGSGIGSDGRFWRSSSSPRIASMEAIANGSRDEDEVEEIVFERMESKPTDAREFPASSSATNAHRKNRIGPGHEEEEEENASSSMLRNAVASVPAPSFSSSGLKRNGSINDDGGKPDAAEVLTEVRDVVDTPDILRCLNLDECNPDIRERALRKLVDVMQSASQSYHGGDRERCISDFILENDVIEAITKSMWADMEIVEVQEAAMHALLFIAASKDMACIGAGERGRQRSHDAGNGNVLSKHECICDSILFTMQNHAAVHGIQLKGTLIFASLAAAGSSSCDDGNAAAAGNADGSLSGAMTMVLNAMSNHGDSRPIRQAGLQALHHQCLLSMYAEDNKRNFIQSRLGNGMPAIDLVIYAMEELQKDTVAMEWACQLCWCLTANEEYLRQVERSSLHEATMTVCQHYMTDPVGVDLVEASIGTIANLSHSERKRREMINTGGVELVLDGLRYHMDDFAIVNEATLALENFALPPYLPDASSSSVFLKSEAVPLLVEGLKKFVDHPEYVIQGLRTLTGFAARCDEAKERIASSEVMPVLQEAVRKHSYPDVLETWSTLVATLAMGETPDVGELLIEHGAIDLLLLAMELSAADERVQDAACLALRNLACNIRKPDEMLFMGEKASNLILVAMDSHRNSASIQTNCCCVFLNFLSKAAAAAPPRGGGKEEEELAFDPKIAASITKAMQSHIESGELLALACGALWIFVDRFDDQKIRVGKEAIDIVACAMVMHPNTASTLEKACGLLSNLSSEKSLAVSIAKAQGVSIVSESMCNNAGSVSLLESGCLTLTNVLLVCPDYADDGAVAISTIVMAMRELMGSASFVKKACEMVWVLASENEHIRSKVLALDGISILMKCLERHGNDSEVETSALGAFNQLAKPIHQKSA